MNIQAAKDDVQAAIRRMPRDFILEVAASFARHKDKILPVIPKIMDELKGHAMAAGMAAAMGTLDLAELEKAGKELLADFIATDLDTSSLPDKGDAEAGYVREE